MASIEKKLKTWEGHQLISSDQARKILEFEESNSPKVNWAGGAVAGCGVVVLLTGIISIIAANWNLIPTGVKLTSYSLIQGILGLLFIKYVNRPGLFREIIILLYAGFFLCGIALIGQIYNLTGTNWEALLLWLILSLLPVLFAQSSLPPHIWFIGLCLCLFDWSTTHADLSFQFPIPVGIAFLTFASSFTSFLPQRFRKAGFTWSFLFLFFVITPLINILWAHSVREGLKWDNAGPSLIFVTVSAFAALISVIQSKEASGSAHKKVISLLILTLYFTYIVPYMKVTPESKLLGFIIFELIWSLIAVSAALSHIKRLFDLATIVITLRFIVGYFEVFGTLASTGIGLIISGFVIISSALLWNKHRKKLLKFLEARA